MAIGEDSEIVATSGIRFTDSQVVTGPDLEEATSPNSPKRAIVIWAEENGGISSGQLEWSFGNGATGAIGIPLVGDWELFGVSVDIETSSSTLPTLAVVDFTGGGSSTIYQFTCTANPHVEQLATPIMVPSGTVVGFRTVNGGSGNSDVRVAAWLEQ